MLIIHKIVRQAALTSVFLATMVRNGSVLDEFVIIALMLDQSSVVSDVYVCVCVYDGVNLFSDIVIINLLLAVRL